MKHKTLLIVAAVFSLLVLLLGMVAYKSEKADSGPAPLAEADRARLVRMHSPTLGKSDAPVTIVEFFDPACGTCRDFYPFVKQMLRQNPDRLRLVLRYAAFHKGSDQVIALIEAARKQGKYWEALEAVLAAQNDWVVNHIAQPERALKHLEGLGLDMARLRADAAAPGAADVVKQDMQDTIALNVAKTPDFFVNGRPLPRFGYEELKALVDQALAAAPR